MKKILNWLFSLVVSLFIVIAIITTILLLFTDDKGVIRLSDYSLVITTDNSMSPDIKEKELLINKNIQFSGLKVDDVVSYSKTVNNKTEIKLGRITSIGRNSSAQVSLIVNDNNGDSHEVTEGNYIGRWTYKKVLFVGVLFGFLLTKTGFLIGIILPLLLLFIYEISKIMYSVRKKQKQDKITEIQNNDTESLDVTSDNTESLDISDTTNNINDTESLDVLNNDSSNENDDDIEIL